MNDGFHLVPFNSSSPVAFVQKRSMAESLFEDLLREGFGCSAIANINGGRLVQAYNALDGDFRWSRWDVPLPRLDQVSHRLLNTQDLVVDVYGGVVAELAAKVSNELSLEDSSCMRDMQYRLHVKRSSISSENEYTIVLRLHHCIQAISTVRICIDVGSSWLRYNSDSKERYTIKVIMDNVYCHPAADGQKITDVMKGALESVLLEDVFTPFNLQVFAATAPLDLRFYCEPESPFEAYLVGNIERKVMDLFSSVAAHYIDSSRLKAG
ncbi:hypothetical protein [Vibrio mediterranei]|uniref:hypothetical protein n=1 Tax=Vibrio mediterranei TaxID=689 RepID=UPI004067BB7C